MLPLFPWWGVVYIWGDTTSEKIGFTLTLRWVLFMCLQRLRVDVPEFEAVFELGLYGYLQIHATSSRRASRKGCAKIDFRKG